jgi:hypothetical protein
VDNLWIHVERSYTRTGPTLEKRSIGARGREGSLGKGIIQGSDLAFQFHEFSFECFDARSERGTAFGH